MSPELVEQLATFEQAIKSTDYTHMMKGEKGRTLVMAINGQEVPQELHTEVSSLQMKYDDYGYTQLVGPLVVGKESFLVTTRTRRNKAIGELKEFPPSS